MQVLDHQQALSKAKIQLMSKLDSAFFTTVCFSVKHIWDDKIPTACTNGKEIRFSPKFFMGLSTEERVFLLLHESMHIAYMHMGRLQGRNPRRWNIAADYVINLMLVQRGFKMPACGLLDHKYAGMSTEQVYDLLPDNPPQQVDMDIVHDESTPEQQKELEGQIQDILIRAQMQSKMSGDKAGTIPGDIEVFLNGLLNPKLPWHKLLQKYLHSFIKSDYSFRKFNRRFFPKYYLPGMDGQKLINLTIGVDISGSVSTHDFHVFVSEVASILRMMKPEKITLIQFDTQLHHIDEITSIQDLMKVKFTGRGGTAITPILDWANQNKPQLMMVFTDGGFSFYDTETKVTTLWLIHNNPGWTAPFGKVIHYNI